MRFLKVHIPVVTHGAE